MCGRFVLMTPGTSLAERFKLEEVPDLEPRYNIAPTQMVAIIRLNLETLHKKSLEIAERTLGLEHPDTASTLNNLAEMYGAQENYKEAEELFNKALSIRTKALGPNHPRVAATLYKMAEMYRSQGCHEKAEELCRRYLALDNRAPKPDRSN